MLYFCVEMNRCESSPCYEGSTCHEVVGGFECECMEGFNETLCNNGKSITFTFQKYS